MDPEGLAVSGSAIGTHNQLIPLAGSLEELGGAAGILEVCPDAVLVLDSRRRKALAVNFDFITMVGGDIETLHGGEFHPLECIHPDDHAAFHDIGDPGIGESAVAVDLRIISSSGTEVPVEAFARHCTSGNKDAWVYFFRPVESRRILEKRLRDQIRVQKKRTVEAVRASLRIYQLTEKIRSAPKLSARLLDVDTEDELFRRAGEFLVSEGFNYLDVAFFSLEDGLLKLKYSSSERTCFNYDVNKKSRYARFLREGKQPSPNSNEQLVALRCKGQVFGVLEVRFDPRERAFFKENSLIEEWHDDIIETIAEILALFIENIRLYQKLRRQTVLDPLTSVFNRHYLLTQLEEEVKRAQRFHRPFSLIFIDVDGFKEVNDTFGHHQGDSVLIEVSEALRSAMRASDCICRYGGDEFVIILPETSIHSAERKAEKLRATIEACQFTQVGAGEGADPIRLTISAGVASAAEGLNADQILQVADSALYRAKRSGKNCVFRIREFEEK